ncbi:ORF380 [White spot syndrome virus]|uniref:ORF380 n=1 Tax=White spot syndrome virus TaxID=342409 RepID=A0A2D3I676_9VIRU|nr:ORF380 [White spot syndrome virus]
MFPQIQQQFLWQYSRQRNKEFEPCGGLSLHLLKQWLCTYLQSSLGHVKDTRHPFWACQFFGQHMRCNIFLAHEGL